MFSSERLIDILELYNPWWKLDKVTDFKVSNYYRTTYFSVLNQIKNDLNINILLKGLRRIGKSTIMHQIIEHLLKEGTNPHNIIYLSYVHPIIKICDFLKCLEIYNLVYPIYDKLQSKEKIWLFIDEVQYSEELVEWIEKNRSQYPNLAIIASSSAQPIIEQKSQNAKTGNKELEKYFKIIKMTPFNFYEYCQFLKLDNLPDLSNFDISQSSIFDICKHINTSEVIFNHFKRYLLVGGFPEFIKGSKDFNDLTLKRFDIVSKIIKPDLNELYNIRNVRQAEKVFLYLCINSSKAINVESLSRTLGQMNKISINNYIEFLKCSNLINDSEPVPINGEIRYKNRPKIYMQDGAIRNAILFTDKTIPNEAEMDSIVEAVLYRHFLSTFDKNAKQIGYYRKAIGNHSEIDIVTQFDDSILLCDVQYTDNPSISKDDIFYEIANSPKHKVSNAILVTKNKSDFGVCDFSTRVPIIKIPACTIMYILGYMESINFTLE